MKKNSNTPDQLRREMAWGLSFWTKNQNALFGRFTMTNDIDYYKSYYDRMGDSSYTGESVKDTSRMLVFKEWLRSYLKPGAKILDIGCGDGVFAKLMPEFEWYGVDINIEKAKANLGDNAFEQDLMKPPYPFESGTFDAIVCSEVLEHLWDLRVVHKEAKRLLKRDGVYVISTPNFDWITNHLEHFRRIMQDRHNHWAWEHVRHYSFDTHQKFLNDTGFVVEKHQGSCEHYCPIFANVAAGIQAGLREKGFEISTPELGVMIGKSVPYYQHTVIIAAKKA